jgi:hypothetical protein
MHAQDKRIVRSVRANRPMHGAEVHIEARTFLIV